jgi:hypothetical protein
LTAILHNERRRGGPGTASLGLRMRGKKERCVQPLVGRRVRQVVGGHSIVGLFSVYNMSLLTLVRTSGGFDGWSVDMNYMKYSIFCEPELHDHHDTPIT